MSGLGLDQGQSRASKHSNMRRTGQFTSSWTRVNGAERGNAVVTKHRHDGALGTGKSGEGEHGSADGGYLHGCGWCRGGQQPVCGRRAAEQEITSVVTSFFPAGTWPVSVTFIQFVSLISGQFPHVIFRRQ